MRVMWLCVRVLLALPVTAQTRLVPHTLRLIDGRNVTLNVARGFDIDVAMEGLRRVRFMAASPDGRIFVTDMHSLADNRLGAVYILEGWDAVTHHFARKVTYLNHLRNPNNLAFYTDEAGQSWLYLALTDKLLRYRYTPGDEAPPSQPEVLAAFPDYGLNYKYGGWHLTRTVAIGKLHGRPTVYVSVGSSCNACREKEAVRATLTAMNPDGSNARIIGRGLRNAVGLVLVPGSREFPGGALLGTNMGADHLGDGAPEDTFLVLDSARQQEVSVQDFGWPTCFFAEGVAHADRLVADPQPGDKTFPQSPTGPAPVQMDCGRVPIPYATFAAHSSPLGVAWFGEDARLLRNSFLVALHGAGHPRIGTGYRVVRIVPGKRQPEDFITGFLTNAGGRPVAAGRPCGLLPMGQVNFLLTDDHAGTIYWVHPER